MGLFEKKKRTELEDEVEKGKGSEGLGKSGPKGFGKPIEEDYVRLYNNVTSNLCIIADESPTMDMNGLTFTEEDGTINILYKVKFCREDFTMEVPKEAMVYKVYKDRAPEILDNPYSIEHEPGRIIKEPGVDFCKPGNAIFEIQKIINYRRKKGLDTSSRLPKVD